MLGVAGEAYSWQIYVRSLGMAGMVGPPTPELCGSALYLLRWMKSSSPVWP